MDASAVCHDPVDWLDDRTGAFTNERTVAKWALSTRGLVLRIATDIHACGPISSRASSVEISGMVAALDLSVDMYCAIVFVRYRLRKVDFPVDCEFDDTFHIRVSSSRKDRSSRPGPIDHESVRIVHFLSAA